MYTFNLYYRTPLVVLLWSLFCMYILCPILFSSQRDDYGYFYVMSGIMGLGYLVIEFIYRDYNHIWKGEWIGLYGYVLLYSAYSPMIPVIGSVVNVTPILKAIVE